MPGSRWSLVVDSDGVRCWRWSCWQRVGSSLSAALGGRLGAVVARSNWRRPRTLVATRSTTREAPYRHVQDDAAHDGFRRSYGFRGIIWANAGPSTRPRAARRCIPLSRSPQPSDVSRPRPRRPDGGKDATGDPPSGALQPIGTRPSTTVTPRAKPRPTGRRSGRGNEWAVLQWWWPRQADLTKPKFIEVKKAQAMVAAVSRAWVLLAASLSRQRPHRADKVADTALGQIVKVEPADAFGREGVRASPPGRSPGVGRRVSRHGQCFVPRCHGERDGRGWCPSSSSHARSAPTGTSKRPPTALTGNSPLRARRRTTDSERPTSSAASGIETASRSIVTSLATVDLRAVGRPRRRPRSAPRRPPLTAVRPTAELSAHRS